MAPRNTEYVKIGEWHKQASRDINSTQIMINAAGGNGAVIQLCVQQLADALCQTKLSAVQTAKDDGALKLYHDTYNLGSKLIGSVAGVSEPRTWFKIKAFLDEMETYLAKAKSIGKRKAVLSPSVVPSDADDSDDDGILDIKVGRGLGSSKHAAPVVKVEDTVKELKFTRNKPVEASVDSNKKVHITKAVSNTVPETFEEKRLRDMAHESVLKQIGLFPFVDINKLSLDDLTSIANFLRHEVTSLQHGILHQAGIYKNTYNQLSDVNRIRLEKLQLDGPSPIEVDGAENGPDKENAPPAGPSGDN
ncbi:hypothetical protein PQX77_021368 [Marasmius sp. AFHP31]|nr:hypothetical protein PQX77_021368 [Marasmius sp. AFHP31]